MADPKISSITPITTRVGMIVNLAESPDDATGSSTVLAARRGTDQDLFYVDCSGPFTKWFMGKALFSPYTSSYQSIASLAGLYAEVNDSSGTDVVNWSVLADLPDPATNTWTKFKGGLYNIGSPEVEYEGPPKPPTLTATVTETGKTSLAWSMGTNILGLDMVSTLRWRLAIPAGTGETARDIVVARSQYNPRQFGPKIYRLGKGKILQFPLEGSVSEAEDVLAFPAGYENEDDVFTGKVIWGRPKVGRRSNGNWLVYMRSDGSIWEYDLVTLTWSKLTNAIRTIYSHADTAPGTDTNLDDFGAGVQVAPGWYSNRPINDLAQRAWLVHTATSGKQMAIASTTATHGWRADKSTDNWTTGGATDKTDLITDLDTGATSECKFYYVSSTTPIPIAFPKPWNASTGNGRYALVYDKDGIQYFDYAGNRGGNNHRSNCVLIRAKRTKTLKDGSYSYGSWSVNLIPLTAFWCQQLNISTPTIYQSEVADIAEDSNGDIVIGLFGNGITSSADGFCQGLLFWNATDGWYKMFLCPWVYNNSYDWEIGSIAPFSITGLSGIYYANPVVGSSENWRDDQRIGRYAADGGLTQYYTATGAFQSAFADYGISQSATMKGPLGGMYADDDDLYILANQDITGTTNDILLKATIGSDGALTPSDGWDLGYDTWHPGAWTGLVIDTPTDSVSTASQRIIFEDLTSADLQKLTVSYASKTSLTVTALWSPSFSSNFGAGRRIVFADTRGNVYRLPLGSVGPWQITSSDTDQNGWRLFNSLAAGDQLYYVVAQTIPSVQWTNEEAELTTTSKALTGLASTVHWLAQVKALDSGGESDWRGIFFLAAVAGPPEAETVEIFTTKEGNLVQWDGGVTYKLEYRKASADAWTKLVDNYQGREYKHTGLTNGDSAQYRLSGTNSAGTKVNEVATVDNIGIAESGMYLPANRYDRPPFASAVYQERQLLVTEGDGSMYYAYGSPVAVDNLLGLDRDDIRAWSVGAKFKKNDVVGYQVIDTITGDEETFYMIRWYVYRCLAPHTAADASYAPHPNARGLWQTVGLVDTELSTTFASPISAVITIATTDAHGVTAAKTIPMAHMDSPISFADSDRPEEAGEYRFGTRGPLYNLPWRPFGDWATLRSLAHQVIAVSLVDRNNVNNSTYYRSLSGTESPGQLLIRWSAGKWLLYNITRARISDNGLRCVFDGTLTTVREGDNTNDIPVDIDLNVDFIFTFAPPT